MFPVRRWFDTKRGTPLEPKERFNVHLFSAARPAVIRGYPIGMVLGDDSAVFDAKYRIHSVCIRLSGGMTVK
jgi:hypothetical protein